MVDPFWKNIQPTTGGNYSDGDEDLRCSARHTGLSVPVR